MNYTLERLQREMKDELERCDIRVDPAAGVILYRDTAYRISSFAPTYKATRLINQCINDAKERRAAAQAARQTDLFGSPEILK